MIQSSSSYQYKNISLSFTPYFSFSEPEFSVQLALVDSSSVLYKQNKNDLFSYVWLSSFVTTEVLLNALLLYTSDRNINSSDHRSVMNVLEIGSGSGLVSCALLKYFPSFTKIYSTDFNPSSIELLQHNFKLQYPNVGNTNIDNINTPVALLYNFHDKLCLDVEFDLVICSDVIYMHNSLSSLRRLVLEDSMGKLFLFVDPGRVYFDEFVDLFKQEQQVQVKVFKFQNIQCINSNTVMKNVSFLLVWRDDGGRLSERIIDSLSKLQQNRATEGEVGDLTYSYCVSVKDFP